MGLTTHFASPARAAPKQVRLEHEQQIANPVVAKLLNSFPEPAVILNRHRQIVLANDKLCALLGKAGDDLLGMRPGEALDCIRWREEPSGCGTTKFCRFCGAASAIVQSQMSNTAVVEECRITTGSNSGTDYLDLRVWATPLDDNEEFTVFAIRDISDEKRRMVLEQMFFHDILNSASGLRGLLEIWPDQTAPDEQKVRQMASDLVDQLLEEIRSGRDLIAAERGELEPHFQQLDAGELILNVCALYSRHTVASGKRIRTGAISGSTLIRTDSVLMRRVLGNLLKNALEASRAGQTVTVSFHNETAPAFEVHNDTAMPEEVKLQIFQRSFTTKMGPGHGIGTYSIKMLTERYLGGSVEFRSTFEKGTTFTVKLPR